MIKAEITCDRCGAITKSEYGSINYCYVRLPTAFWGPSADLCEACQHEFIQVWKSWVKPIERPTQLPKRKWLGFLRRA